MSSPSLLEKSIISDHLLTSNLLIPYLAIDDILPIIACSKQTRRVIDKAIITFNTTQCQPHKVPKYYVKRRMIIARRKQLHMIKESKLTLTNARELGVACNETAVFINDIVTANEVMEPVVLDYICKRINDHCITVSVLDNRHRDYLRDYIQECSTYKINPKFINEYSHEMTVIMNELINTAKTSYSKCARYMYANNFMLRTMFGHGYIDVIIENGHLTLVYPASETP